MENQKIVILGCGNVAGFFAEKLNQLSHTLLQVYHPNIQKAKAFAKAYHSEAISSISDINTNADLYLIAVKDNVIGNLAGAIPNTKGLVIHTSGSVNLEALHPHKRAAVFYPLQTFTKGIITANQNFPLLVESNHKADEEYLKELAENMGLQVYFINSTQRSEIHLAAVFAANFSNHCIKIGYDLMHRYHHDADMLLPLIKESINKLNYISPEQAQTGPAIRLDTFTIEKHLSMLQNEASLKKMYDLLTKNIQSKPL